MAFRETHRGLRSTSRWHLVQPPAPTPADVCGLPAGQTSVSGELPSDRSGSQGRAQRVCLWTALLRVPGMSRPGVALGRAHLWLDLDHVYSLSECIRPPLNNPPTAAQVSETAHCQMNTAASSTPLNRFHLSEGEAGRKQ